MIRKLFSLLLLSLILSLTVWAQTTAQKLGYGPNEKIILVHADDIGMSHSVNVASIEAFKHNMVTSGSIMVPCPWFRPGAGRLPASSVTRVTEPFPTDSRPPSEPWESKPECPARPAAVIVQPARRLRGASPVRGYRPG